MPLTPGTPLLVRGRVWSLEEDEPLPGTVVDVWHAGAGGFYQDDQEEVLHRARIVSNEAGDYEFEAILPGYFEQSPGKVRPRHIHFRVSHREHFELTTQMYFESDPQAAKDPNVKSELTVPLRTVKTPDGEYLRCRFDLVLSSTR